MTNTFRLELIEMVERSFILIACHLITLTKSNVKSQFFFLFIEIDSACYKKNTSTYIKLKKYPNHTLKKESQRIQKEKFNMSFFFFQ